MAAKKTRLKRTSINKSEFIRKLPRTLSGAEVVAKAKAKGIKFDEKYVYRIRALARAKKKGGAKTAAARKPNATAAPSPAQPTTSKAAFVRSLPASVPAKAVVAQAKAAGITVSTAYVYIVRAGAKEHRATARVGRSIPRPIGTTALAESLLRALGAEVGLGKALELLSAERERVKRLILR